MANEKRLIDANALAERAFTPMGAMCGRVIRITDLYTAPTVDAVEVVHGRWISWEEVFPRSIFVNSGRKKKGFCSYCGVLRDKENYCPNCGAKMDGDGNADNH